MTSNVASKEIQDVGQRLALIEADADKWEREYENIQESVRQELRTYFRPEFLNRIDDIVIFRNLTREQIKDIVEIQMAHLRKLLAEKRMTLTLSDGVKEVLAEKGYDPVFGARPLKRVIQKYLQDPLSMKVLLEEFVEGDSITVDRIGTTDAFMFKKANT